MSRCRRNDDSEKNSNTLFYPASWLSTRILNIMTSRPIVTMMRSVKENQPRTIALVPTPDMTAPFPKSSAMVLAATEAVCCHSTDTSTKMDEMKMMARATWLTGRLGKGLTSRSEPMESSSSCQPGKVASRRKQMKAKMMAMMLGGKRYVSLFVSLVLIFCLFFLIFFSFFFGDLLQRIVDRAGGDEFERQMKKRAKFDISETHMRYGNTTMSLNWLASQIKLSGSWSTLTS